MDIDDDSDKGKGWDEARLPAKWTLRTHCKGCGEPVNEDNLIVICAGCNLRGCQKCMVKSKDYEEWFCPDSENQAEPLKDCQILWLDKVVDKLHGQITRLLANQSMEE